VPTWSGRFYVPSSSMCSPVDRRLGAATSMSTDLVWTPSNSDLTGAGAGVTDLTGLVHHTDAGSQYTSSRSPQGSSRPGVVPSVGSVGDAYDTPCPSP